MAKRKGLGAEDHLQHSVINYLLYQYNVIAIPNNTESNKTWGEQRQFKYNGGRKGVLDLFVPIIEGGYGGLFLELKAENKNPYKLNGELRKDKNGTLQAQEDSIKRLLSYGYYATFAVGFDQTKEIIDKYVKGEIMPENY